MTSFLGNIDVGEKRDTVDTRNTMEELVSKVRIQYDVILERKTVGKQKK